MTLLLLALAACDDAPPPESGVPPSPEAPVAPDTSRLFRASMALRGHPPTRDEVLELVEHPDQLEALVRGMLDDPGFAETMADMHAEQLKLRWDVIAKPPNTGPLEAWPKGAIAYSADEPPVKLAERIVTSGRPYTDLVAGDLAMSDPLSSIIYGLPHDPAGPEWQETWWTDGRPRVGILASSAAWQRFQAPDQNRMRQRAAWILEDLLCEDLAERSGGGIIDPHMAEDAVREDPQCVGCHAVMDPVASGLYGFIRHALANEISGAYEADCQNEAASLCYPLEFWQPELIGDRVKFGGPPISLYGTPAADLEDLGQLIADDPRFADCTTRRFWGWMTHQEPRSVDEQLTDELVGVLLDAEWDARELAVAIALHPRFADGSADAPPHAIRPGQIDRTIRALTGYEWRADPDFQGCVEAGSCWGPVELATTDKHGLRSLLGGIDGWTIVDPVGGAYPSRELGLDWVATEAAHHVVERDDALADGTGELLTWGATTDEARGREQLAELHLRLFALPVAPDSPQVDAAWGLLQALLDTTGDAKTAWKSVLSAFLQDPRLVVL